MNQVKRSFTKAPKLPKSSTIPTLSFTLMHQKFTLVPKPVLDNLISTYKMNKKRLKKNTSLNKIILILKLANDPNAIVIECYSAAWVSHLYILCSEYDLYEKLIGLNIDQYNEHLTINANDILIYNCPIHGARSINQKTYEVYSQQLLKWTENTATQLLNKSVEDKGVRSLKRFRIGTILIRTFIIPKKVMRKLQTLCELI